MITVQLTSENTSNTPMVILPSNVAWLSANATPPELISITGVPSIFDDFTEPVPLLQPGSGHHDASGSPSRFSRSHLLPLEMIGLPFVSLVKPGRKPLPGCSPSLSGKRRPRPRLRPWRWLLQSPSPRLSLPQTLLLLNSRCSPIHLRQNYR